MMTRTSASECSIRRSCGRCWDNAPGRPLLTFFVDDHGRDEGTLTVAGLVEAAEQVARPAARMADLGR